VVLTVLMTRGESVDVPEIFLSPIIMVINSMKF
jgi:hypothetical protein